MLNTVTNNMNVLLTEEQKAAQMDQLWDMYATGVNSALFNEWVTLPSKDLLKVKQLSENVFHEVMIDFILDYRKFYNTF